MSKDYKHIQTKEDYTKLLNSGMFWEVHPELSGNWQDDEMDTRQQIVDILDHFTQCLGVDLDGSDVYGIHDNKLNELTEILVSILKQ